MNEWNFHSKPAKLRPSSGVPVDGDAFWPRPAVMIPLRNIIYEGGSARIFGLRRIGKSSVLKELMRHLKNDGRHLPIEARMDNQSGPGAFMGTVLRQLPKDKATYVREKVAEMGGFGEAVHRVLSLLGTQDMNILKNQENELSKNWDALSQHLTHVLNEIKDDRKVVLFMDELPDFVRNAINDGMDAKFFKKFFETLKFWREVVGISMVLSGSIGLSRILRLHNLRRDDIISVPHISLPPLKEAEMKDMLDALQAHNEIPVWSTAIRDALIDQVDDGIPWLLQTARNTLRDAQAIQPEIYNTEQSVLHNLKHILDPPVNAGGQRTYAQARNEILEQFTVRLKDYAAIGPGWKENALATLDVVHRESSVPRNRIKDVMKIPADPSEVRELLTMMEEDGFLTLVQDHAKFASGLVQRWYING